MADSVVINTGPLIAIARAGLLEVIGHLPFKFICPTEVRAELDAGEAAGYPAIRPPWLETVPLVAPLNALGRAALDLGEAAVIQLAIEKHVPIVCLDDRKGRRAALAAGLAITGSLGLLVRSKTLGLVPAIRPALDKALQLGTWYDPDLIRRVLDAVGE